MASAMVMGGGGDVFMAGAGDYHPQPLLEPPPPPERRGGLKRQLETLAVAMDADLQSKRVATIDTRLEEFFRNMQSSDLDRGNSIMHALRTNFQKFDTEKYYRSKDQRQIQHRICAGLSKLAYRAAIRTHEQVIMRYNRFESLHSEIFLTAPRRGGKTEAIVQSICAMLESVPNVDIASFAPSGRAAGVDSGLMGHVRKRLKMTVGIDYSKLEKHNKEILVIPKTSNDVRKFKAYSAAATDKYVFSLYACVRVYIYAPSPGKFYSSPRGFYQKARMYWLPVCLYHPHHLPPPTRKNLLPCSQKTLTRPIRGRRRRG